MWIRMNALAAAALLSFWSTGVAHAQMRNPSMNTQAWMAHQRMMNQMDMMRRSQQFQAMARAREAQGRAKKPAQGGAGKKVKAAPKKPK